MDRETSNRPERRTALIARELARYRIDIAAISETRLEDEGSVAEPKGLAIKSTLIRQLPDLPTAINERLMKLRFSMNRSRHVTVISAYSDQQR
ncbi:hypothetical protein ACOMHN_060767 [Nucella lapillus]